MPTDTLPELDEFADELAALAADDALLIGVPDVCRRLRIGTSNFYALRRAGRMPLTAIRLGRAVRFCPDELRRWVRAGCPAADRWASMTADRGAD